MTHEHALTSQQRRHLLREVYHTLHLVEPGLFGHHNVHRPGGFDAITERLDQLVDIVRKTGTPLREAHMAMLLDQVCEKCPHQVPSLHCPLRRIDGCVLYQHSEATLRTIVRVLAELGGIGPLAGYAASTDGASND